MTIADELAVKVSIDMENKSDLLVIRSKSKKFFVIKIVVTRIEAGIGHGLSIGGFVRKDEADDLAKLLRGHSIPPYMLEGIAMTDEIMSPLRSTKKSTTIQTSQVMSLRISDK